MEFYPSFHLIWLLWPWMNFSCGSSLISLPAAARKGKGGRQTERKGVNELLGKIELISIRATVPVKLHLPKQGSRETNV